jgi:hypothetical protein
MEIHIRLQQSNMIRKIIIIREILIPIHIDDIRIIITVIIQIQMMDTAHNLIVMTIIIMIIKIVILIQIMVRIHIVARKIKSRQGLIVTLDIKALPT